MWVYVQLHVVVVLAEGRALQLLDMALLDPQRRGLGNGDAGILRCVHTTGYLMPGLNEKGIGFLLRFAGLDVSFAFLIKIIGNPGRLRVPTRFPRALAYGRHRNRSNVLRVSVRSERLRLCRRNFRLSRSQREGSSSAP